MYGLRERQFQRFHEMAQRSNEPTGLALLKLLERRLDNVVYRFGWARSRPQARQIVNHGQVRVNGLRVDIPSYLVSPGERIQLDPRAMNIPDVQALLNDHPTVPDWLARKNGSGRVVREPRREEIDQDIEEQRIVEFYAR